MNELGDKAAAAFHEAGHAVVANALRHRGIFGIRVKLNPKPTTFWNSSQNQQADGRPNLIIRMAGLEAEFIRFGQYYDHEHHARALRNGYSPAQIDRAHRVARRLLRYRWPEVERIAGVLLKKGRFGY